MSNTLGPDFVDWGCPIDWAAPLNRSLVGWWLVAPNRMGFGTSAARDMVRRNRDAVTAALPATSTSGWQAATRRGGWGSFAFDGTDDYVACGDPASMAFGTGAFSVAFWRKGPNADLNQKYIVSKYGATGWGIVQTSDAWSGGAGKKIGFVLDAGGAGARAWSTTAAVDDGQWHHVVCVSDGSAGFIYIDGVAAALTTNRNVGGWPNVTTATALNIGRYSGGSNYDQSSLDDVRIYNRALPAVEVRRLYQASAAGYPDELHRVEPWFSTAQIAGMLLARRRAVA